MKCEAHQYLADVRCFLSLLLFLCVVAKQFFWSPQTGTSLWQLDFPAESEDIGLDSLLFLGCSAPFQGETTAVNVAAQPINSQINGYS